MVTVELPKSWISNDWWWGLLLMGALILLHSRSPLLLGLSILLGALVLRFTKSRQTSRFKVC